MQLQSIDSSLGWIQVSHHVNSTYLMKRFSSLEALSRALKKNVFLKHYILLLNISIQNSPWALGLEIDTFKKTKTQVMNTACGLLVFLEMSDLLHDLV